MCLNHLGTIPPTPICGKIDFHKTNLWCQKRWGLLCQNHDSVSKLTTYVTAPTSFSTLPESENNRLSFPTFKDTIFFFSFWQY